jgi:hypothetical protein
MRLSPASAVGIFAGAFAAVIFASPPASAQSPYSYPWCAKYFSRVYATSCYYTSWQQCQDTISGIGGYCFQSPYYHASVLAARRWRS